MQYKIVTAPKSLNGTPENAAHAFEDLINNYAAEGWRYHSMETITTVEKAGCGGNDRTYTTLYLLIFVREK